MAQLVVMTNVVLVKVVMVEVGGVVMVVGVAAVVEGLSGMSRKERVEGSADECGRGGVLRWAVGVGVAGTWSRPRWP